MPAPQQIPPPAPVPVVPSQTNANWMLVGKIAAAMLSLLVYGYKDHADVLGDLSQLTDWGAVFGFLGVLAAAIRSHSNAKEARQAEAASAAAPPCDEHGQRHSDITLKAALSQAADEDNHAKARAILKILENPDEVAE